MSVETDPVKRLTYLFSGSIIAFPSAAITLGLLTSPVLYWSLQGNPVVGGVAVTALTGWSLYLGQKVVLEEGTDLPAEYADLDWRWQAALTVLGIIYYNVVLLATVYASIQIAAAGFGLVGAVLAFTYPIYDMLSTERGFPLSISGAFMLVIYVLLLTWVISENITLETARVDELVIEFVGGRQRRFN